MPVQKRFFYSATLVPPVAIQRVYGRKIAAIVRDMIKSYQPLLDLYKSKSPQMAMDADGAWLSTDVEKLLKKLQSYWDNYLDENAQKIAKDMINKVLRNSNLQVQNALKNYIAKERWELIRDKIPVPMQQAIKSHIAENVSLIKSVANQYHERIAGAIYRAITGTGTLTNLRREFLKYGKMSERRAKLITSDQVNKVFNTLSARRMASVGINKVRWIHGFPKEPRPYHARVWDGKSGKKDGHPNGLNGFIFSLDNPPIIDEKTGERGLPGRLPFCSCRMEPVIDEYE